MRISVFGLGYVGTVSAACLAKRGHQVIGVDPSPLKVDAINAGRSPVVEPGLAARVGDAVAKRHLIATGDPTPAIAGSELSLVCVGTPSLPNGRVDLRFLERCCIGIGACLAAKAGRHLVVIRSTVPPGTVQAQVVPWLEAASGKRIGDEIGLCYQPEFLREGQAIQDFEAPAKTVIAASDDASAEQLAGLYADLEAPLIRVDFTTAELLKYVDNAWHALKVGFANEIGSIAKALEVDGHAAMAAFCLDRKLNLSAAYLRPGAPFGGSCLPKDLRALHHTTRALDLELPILGAVLDSNRRHLERILARALAGPGRRVGVLGLSFKPGTDDLRESPMVELVERLLGKGYEVRVFDPLVDPQALTGANRAYTLAHLPHIARLMVGTIDAALADAELLLIGHVDPAHLPRLAAAASHCRIIDCARVDAPLARLPGYDGVCW